MRAGEIVERIRHMLKVKDCKHVCLFCEYYEICKEEAKTNEHETVSYTHLTLPTILLV